MIVSRRKCKIAKELRFVFLLFDLMNQRNTDLKSCAIPKCGESCHLESFEKGMPDKLVQNMNFLM